jgi:hypothetical protein
MPDYKITSDGWLIRVNPVAPAPVYGIDEDVYNFLYPDIKYLGLRLTTDKRAVISKEKFDANKYTQDSAAIVNSDYWQIV